LPEGLQKEYLLIIRTVQFAGILLIKTRFSVFFFEDI